MQHFVCPGVCVLLWGESAEHLRDSRRCKHGKELLVVMFPLCPPLLSVVGKLQPLKCMLLSPKTWQCEEFSCQTRSMETVWVVGRKSSNSVSRILIVTIKTPFNFSWPTNILIFVNMRREFHLRLKCRLTIFWQNIFYVKKSSILFQWSQVTFHFWSLYYKILSQRNYFVLFLLLNFRDVRVLNSL